MSKSNYLEESLLNTIFRAVAFPTLGASVYVALFTAAPSDTGGGTEVSGGSYARTGVTRATGQFKDPSTATQGTTNNTNAITFPTATGSWGTVTHIGVFDASTSGNLLYWAALTASKTVGSGDTFSIPANSLVVSED